MSEKEIKDLNRNEYYEWKKERVKELAKTGMRVADIAKELNMGEEDMYSFLSRNFGGVRRLRESVGVNPDGVSDTEPIKTKVPNTAKVPNTTSVTKVENIPTLDLKKAAKEEKRVGVVSKESTINSIFKETLRKERKALLDSFKDELLEEKEQLVEMMKQGLETTRIELLNNFQKELINDLSEMVKEL